VVPLASSEWSKLSHAYGSAANIPALLLGLESFPSSLGNAEPWFTLWSSLYHQGDIFSASFAAVPHVVRVLSSAPTRATFDYFLFPASVEVARTTQHLEIPAFLAASYIESLARLPALAAAAVSVGSDSELSQAALAAFAAGVGQTHLARLLLEMESGDLPEILDWYEQHR
jgi:hypothetical protein